MPRPDSERRRKLVVDRDLQVRLVGRMACAFLGSLLLFLGISLGAPVLLGAISGLPGWGLDAFAYRLRLLVAFVALPLLSGVLVLFAVGVRSTFGIAGPLYRFSRVFRDLTELRLPRGVRIRRNDMLQQTARLFDESLVALHEHASRLKQLAGDARRELEDAIESDPQLAEPLSRMRARLEALCDECARSTLLPCAPYSETPTAIAASESAREPVRPREPVDALPS